MLLARGRWGSGESEISLTMGVLGVAWRLPRLVRQRPNGALPHGITHHDLTPNKVVADAMFVGQKWLGLWSEAAARGMQRESAKRLTCQDVRNAKRSFVVTRTSCSQRKRQDAG